MGIPRLVAAIRFAVAGNFAIHRLVALLNAVGDVFDRFARSERVSDLAVSPSYSVTRSTASAVTATAGSSAITRRQAPNSARVSAPVPHTSERVGGRQAVVEQLADRGQRLGRQVGVSTSEIVGEVGGQRALGAGIVHGGNAVCANGSPPARGEKFQSVGQFGQVAHAHRAGGRAERLPGRVLAGQRTRVRRRPSRGPRGEPPTGRITTGTSRSAARSSTRRSRGAERGVSISSRDDPGLGIVERVLDVVGGVGDEFLTRGDRQPETEPAAGAQQRRERRTGMGDQADRRPPAADRAPGSPARAPRARCSRSPCSPLRTPPCPAAVAVAVTCSRSPRADPNSTADRAPAAAAASNWPTSAVSGTPSRTRSTGFVEVRQRRRAGQLADAVVARIHQVHTGRTALRLNDHARRRRCRAARLAPTTATDRAPSMAATAARRAASIGRA